MGHKYPGTTLPEKTRVARRYTVVSGGVGRSAIRRVKGIHDQVMCTDVRGGLEALWFKNVTLLRTKDRGYIRHKGPFRRSTTVLWFSPWVSRWSGAPVVNMALLDVSTGRRKYPQMYDIELRSTRGRHGS